MQPKKPALFAFRYLLVQVPRDLCSRGGRQSGTQLPPPQFRVFLERRYIGWPEYSLTFNICSLSTQASIDCYALRQEFWSSCTLSFPRGKVGRYQLLHCSAAYAGRVGIPTSGARKWESLSNSLSHGRAYLSWLKTKIADPRVWTSFEPHLPRRLLGLRMASTLNSCRDRELPPGRSWACAARRDYQPDNTEGD